VPPFKPLGKEPLSIMVRRNFFNAFSALEGEDFLNKRTAFRPGVPPFRRTSRLLGLSADELPWGAHPER
jgi:hypothetical protein